MFSCCCEKRNLDQGGEEAPEEEEADPAQPGRDIRQSVYKMLQSRVGRVEKFKHTSTVMFLGKGVVMAGLIILLVQVIAGTEVCYLEADTSELPLGLQRMLMEPSPLNSYRCPYNDRLDVAYTFDLVPPAENDTSETNVTMVRVNFADVLPKKSQNDASDDYRAQGEATAVELCGKLCSVKSCKCFTKIIFSEACYVDTYEYGLQIDEVSSTDKRRSMFSIYFIICVFILIFLTLFYSIYKMVGIMCGGKRVGTANIG